MPFFPKMMILIKLGGSVITDKNRPLTARLDVVQRLAYEIAACEEKVVLIHGGGSFGHIKAAEHCIHEPADNGEVSRDTGKTGEDGEDCQDNQRELHGDADDAGRATQTGVLGRF